MPIITETGSAPETFARPGEDALPAGAVLVSPTRLDEALARGGPVGVEIGNDADLATLVPHLDRIALIAVAFPKFADGRGFSLARRLRRLGFAGRLRAVGPVIADQFGHLLRVGFDEAEIPEAMAARQPVETWVAQAARFAVTYQRGLLRAGSILDARRAAHG